jgi:hypothetical protein
MFLVSYKLIDFYGRRVCPWGAQRPAPKLRLPFFTIRSGALGNIGKGKLEHTNSVCVSDTDYLVCKRK